MFSRRKLTIVQFLILALISGTISKFVPLEIPPLQYAKCKEVSHDISDVLETVQGMLSNPTPSSRPLSCLEVKESSPGSPSGYYTLSDGTGNTNIVYCNMDELYSCPSLEQALRGIQLSLDQTTHSVTSQLDNIQHATNTFGTSINNTLNNVLEGQEFAYTLNTAMNNTMNSVLEGQDYSNTLSTAINNTVNGVLEGQDCSNTRELSTAINNTVNSVLVGQDYTNTLIKASNYDIYQVLNRQDYFATISTAINDTVNDVLNVTQKLIHLHSPASCQEAINKTTNLTTETSFEDLCNTSGSWTRVGFLNMSDPTQNCSSPFELYESNEVRACGRPHPLKSHICDSVTFSVNQTSYSQVCGRVIGYQYYSIDGFTTAGGSTINESYLDGVSLTHGYPRQHIWSLAAAQRVNSSSSSCPCAGGGSPPAFVGNDYFCESGSNGHPVEKIMYTSDPLWDGQGCVGGEATCCQVIGIPWFHKVLNTFTTDFIELRMCGHSDEDTPLSLYEIYVK